MIEFENFEQLHVDLLQLLVKMMVFDPVVDRFLVHFQGVCFFGEVNFFVLKVKCFYFQVTLFFLTFAPSFIFGVDYLFLTESIRSLHFGLKSDLLDAFLEIKISFGV